MDCIVLIRSSVCVRMDTIKIGVVRNRNVVDAIHHVVHVMVLVVGTV